MTLLHRAVIVRVLAWLALVASPGLAAAQGQAGQGQSPMPGAGAGAAGGAVVYRCGPGQYSSEPCPGGVKLDTPAPPSAEQQRLAREAAARDAQLARQLAEERKAREREAAKQTAATLGSKSAASAPTVAEKSPPKTKKDKKGAAARKAKSRDQAADRPRPTPRAKKTAKP